MESIVNTGVTPSAAPRPPETAGAPAARQGSRETRGQACTADPANPGVVAETVAAPAGRVRPVAAAPIAGAEAAAELLAQVREQVLRQPDRALLAHAPPGADATLRLLDG